MRRLLLAIIGLSIALLCYSSFSARTSAAGSANVASASAVDDFQLVKVAEGVYAAIAKPGGLASGNAGFVIGDGGVLVVDTFFTPIAVEELIGEIGKLSRQPIKYVLNTHYHLDHTGGNQVFAARGIPIIAHDNVVKWQTTKNKRFLPSPEDLKKRRDDAAKQLNETPADQKDKRAQLLRQIARLDAMTQIKLTDPTVTFSTGMLHLYLGTREVILRTVPGHTGGDTVAFVPDANVMFMGDMGWSRTLPNLVDATVSDWIGSLDLILTHHADARFIPGHGEVAGANDIRDFRDYLDQLRGTVRRAIDNGLSVDQAKEQLQVPDKYKAFAFQNFAKPNIEDMYKELKGTKQTQ